MPSSQFANLDDAKKILRSGGVLVYPTETFYAIGCRADASASIALIGEIKGRPDNKPFPLIIGETAQASLVSDISLLPRTTMDLFWPGPLTILLPALDRLDPRLKNGQNKVALRLPTSGIARDLARDCGYPIIATSANFAGFPPPSTLFEADPKFMERLGEKEVAVLRDDGEGKYRRPSTLIEFTEPEKNAARILREGAVTRAELEEKGITVIRAFPEDNL